MLSRARFERVGWPGEKAQLARLTVVFTVVCSARSGRYFLSWPKNGASGFLVDFGHMMIGAVDASPEPSSLVGKTGARRVAKPDDLSPFLVQNSLIFAKQKGSHQAAVGRERQPKASDAVRRSLRGGRRSSGRGGGSLERLPHICCSQPWALMTSISTTSTSTNRCGNQTSGAHAFDAMLSP